MNVTRRDFLKASSALTAGAVLSPLPAAAMKPANDKIGVALIGCRGMGWGNLSDFLLHPDVHCVALADIDQQVLASRGADLEKKQGKKAALYRDYRKVLERKDVDVVIIGTPDHWHCLQFVDACKAGKDVYVEKPVGNSIAECDVMVAAAKKYQRVVQVGQQQRSGKHWQEMVQYLRSGVLGTIGRVHIWANFNYAGIPEKLPDGEIPEGVDFDAWLGPAPARSFNKQRFHGSWRMFWDYGGGLMTDWGVHLLDMGLWGMNVETLPEKVIATGGKFYYPEGAHETYDSQTVSFQLPGFVMSWEHSAGVESGPYGRSYGVAFRGINGTLVADRSSWQVYPEWDKKANAARIPEHEVKADHRDHRDHVTNFLECVKTRNFQTACTIENGSLCAKYAHLGNIAARMGGAALVYDPDKKQFNIPEANRYLQPDYRSPLQFPVV